MSRSAHSEWSAGHRSGKGHGIEPGDVASIRLGWRRQGVLLGGRLRQRRPFWGCSHSSTITTITAGIARQVCEHCAHVSVSYVEPAVQLHPKGEAVSTPRRDRVVDLTGLDEAKLFDAIISFEGLPRLLKCGLCAQQAVFAIPDGLRCEEHAWQAAAFLDWDVTEPWVPIRIDRSNA